MRGHEEALPVPGPRQPVHGRGQRGVHGFLHACETGIEPCRSATIALVGDADDVAFTRPQQVIQVDLRMLGEDVADLALLRIVKRDREPVAAFA